MDVRLHCFLKNCKCAVIIFAEFNVILSLDMF